MSMPVVAQFPHECTLGLESWIEVWTDREGNDYLCQCQISDQHLANIIAWMEKQLEKIRSNPGFPSTHDDWVPEDLITEATEEKLNEMIEYQRSRQGVNTWNWGAV
tara:strand:- start:5173 stop:5490 length:318 start_codon:yes stop_codon:yes gene_type:complete